MTAAGRKPQIFRAGKLLNARHFTAKIRNLRANMVKSKLNWLCGILSLFRDYFGTETRTLDKARFSLE
jgi:hypothetical protein